MSNKTVNENSVSYLTVSFYDKNNNLAIPSSGTWKVHDEYTDTVIQPETNITPIASQYELTLTNTINTLLDSNHANETRVVTIKAIWGAGLETYGRYEYDIIGLDYVP